MMLFIFGTLVGMFICLLIPPHELFKKLVVFSLRTSEKVSKKAAELAEKEKSE